MRRRNGLLRNKGEDADHPEGCRFRSFMVDYFARGAALIANKADQWSLRGPSIVRVYDQGSVKERERIENSGFPMVELHRWIG